MAAPIYSQAEAEAMIAERKYLNWTKFNDGVLNRANDEGSRQIELECDSPTYSFILEIRRDHLRGECNILLKGQIGGRTQEGIVRYDIQDNDHDNPRGLPPPTVIGGQPHRHFYSEASIRASLSWHAWAEPIELKKNSFNYLMGAFLAGTNIHFTDSDSRTALFDWMNE